MPEGFQTFAEVIDFAVNREEEAHRFYKDLAQKTDDPFLQQIFKEFAEEEAKHKQALLDLDSQGMERIFTHITDKVKNLNITAQVNDVTPDAHLDIKEALILAMKREDKSNKLYALLGELSEDDTISLLFVGLAKEEARHRHRIEKAYQTLFGEPS